MNRKKTPDLIAASFRSLTLIEIRERWKSKHNIVFLSAIYFDPLL